MRSHELVRKPGRKSRLTVTPTRVTVKVSDEHADIADMLYAVGQKIAENVELDRSLRGCFGVVSQRVTLRTTHPARNPSTRVVVTYNFDGEVIA